MKTKQITKDNAKPYWNEAYQSQQTPWDAGAITTPIKEYIDQLTDKNLAILVPGVGNGHELEYLHNQGFTNCYGLDISELALENFSKRVPSFPKDRLLAIDFFSLQIRFDLVLEQTFFCALPVELRENYAQKMHALLHPKGKLVGVLFNFPLTEQGPPFGGSTDEYQHLFKEKFTLHTLAPCYNSIKPRTGKELFINFQSKES